MVKSKVARNNITFKLSDPYYFIHKSIFKLTTNWKKLIIHVMEIEKNLDYLILFTDNLFIYIFK